MHPLCLLRERLPNPLMSYYMVLNLFKYLIHCDIRDIESVFVPSFWDKDF